MKIALFGGSFNPIHHGHLIIAEAARTYFNLDKIIFIPAGHPPHKPNIPLESKKHRLKMIQLAIKDNPHFLVNDYELQKQGINYTIDTIEHFKKLYPKDNLHFIMGMDLLVQIDTWKMGDKILDSCKFLVGVKPSYSISALPEKTKSRVKLFYIPFIDVSSTFLRTYLKKNISIRYLAPEKVIKYINKNKLYR